MSDSRERQPTPSDQAKVYPEGAITLLVYFLGYVAGGTPPRFDRKSEDPIERDNWRRDQAVKEQLRAMTLGEMLQREWAIEPDKEVLATPLAQFATQHVRSRRTQSALQKMSEQQVTSQDPPLTVAQILDLPVTTLLKNVGISNHVIGNLVTALMEQSGYTIEDLPLEQFKPE